MTKSANPIPKGYQQTKIGVLPVEWEVVKLKTVISKIESGTSVNCSPDSKSNRKILKTSAVTLGAFSPLETKIPLKEEEDKLSTKARAGHILVCRKNSPTLVGSSVLIDCLEQELYLPDLLWQLIPSQNHDGISTFLFYSLNEGHTEFRIRNLASGSSESMRNISKKSYLNLQIPLPPLPEQQKIAKILATWDQAIQTQTQLINAKKEQKRGLMQRLLTGEVRLPGFERSKEKVKSRIGDVPADWEVIPAGKLFKSSSQKKNGELPLLAVTQENGVVDRNDLEGRVTMPSGSTEGYKLIEEGDFVISLRSFQGGLEFSEIKGIVSPAYTVLKNVREVDKSFFKFFFKSHEFIQRLAATVIGIRDGKQISYKDFVTLKFRFPPLEEQTAIANILNTADKEIILLETELTELKEQKRGLMQRLLTGQIRVTV